MNKTKAVIGAVGAAAVLSGVAFGAWSAFEAIMAASLIQQFLIGLAGVGGGAVGLVAAFRRD